MDFAALKSELLTDPEGIGYVGTDAAAAAALLNTVDRPRNRTSMTGKEIKDAIDTGEWDTRTDHQQQIILQLVARDDLDPFGIDAHIMQDAMAGAGGLTLAALIDARVETVSRIRELEIGFGDVVSDGHVAKARAT